MTRDDMIAMRMDAAKVRNAGKFTISHTANKEYARGVDKDGLTKARRATIESIKDKQTYPIDEDIF